MNTLLEKSAYKPLLSTLQGLLGNFGEQLRGKIAVNELEDFTRNGDFTGMQYTALSDTTDPHCLKIDGISLPISGNGSALVDASAFRPCTDEPLQHVLSINGRNLFGPGVTDAVERLLREFRKLSPDTAPQFGCALATLLIDPLGQTYTDFQINFPDITTTEPFGRVAISANWKNYLVIVENTTPDYTEFRLVLYPSYSDTGSDHALCINIEDHPISGELFLKFAAKVQPLVHLCDDTSDIVSIDQIQNLDAPLQLTYKNGPSIYGIPARRQDSDLFISLFDSNGKAISEIRVSNTEIGTGKVRVERCSKSDFERFGFTHTKSEIAAIIDRLWEISEA